MAETTKVVLALGDNRIELEGDKAFVEKQLKELVGLIAGTSDGSTRRKPSEAPNDAAENRPRGGLSLKRYVAEKNPRNAYQAIAVVLHYKREHENQQEMDATEIRNALRQGAYKPPGNLPQALVDTRRRYGYIDRGSARGQWKLVHQGEALVEFDLPPEGP